jgi:hypothetical protein
MTDTRADIDRSLEATAAALAKLSPEQFDRVLTKTHDALLEFIEKEWLPSARARRAAAEAFHASVRVHDFNEWSAS